MTVAKTRNHDLQVVFNQLKQRLPILDLQLDHINRTRGWKIMHITETGGQEILLPKGFGERYSTLEMIAAIESFLLGMEYAYKFSD